MSHTHIDTPSPDRACTESDLDARIAEKTPAAAKLVRDFVCRLTINTRIVSTNGGYITERIERRITGTSTSDVVCTLMAEYGDRVTYMSVRQA